MVIDSLTIIMRAAHVGATGTFIHWGAVLLGQSDTPNVAPAMDQDTKVRLLLFLVGLSLVIPLFALFARWYSISVRRPLKNRLGTASQKSVPREDDWCSKPLVPPGEGPAAKDNDTGL